jgi:hypothetical protein
MTDAEAGEADTGVAMLSRKIGHERRGAGRSSAESRLVAAESKVADVAVPGWVRVARRGGGAGGIDGQRRVARGDVGSARRWRSVAGFRRSRWSGSEGIGTLLIPYWRNKLNSISINLKWVYIESTWWYTKR